MLKVIKASAKLQNTRELFSLNRTINQKFTIHFRTLHFSDI